MKIFSFVLIVLFFVGCSSFQISANHSSYHDKVYYFQHRLLPEWTFQSDGKFFEDISNGEIEQLKTAASEIVSQKFAENISVQSVFENNAVLLLFPQPTQSPECYYILIVKDSNLFQFFTLEKANDIMKVGFKSVVCAWTEKMHLNYGSRKYNDVDSFLKEIANMIETKKIEKKQNEGKE
jgi:hypothetical protein